MSTDNDNPLLLLPIDELQSFPLPEEDAGVRKEGEQGMSIGFLDMILLMLAAVVGYVVFLSLMVHKKVEERPQKDDAPLTAAKSSDMDAKALYSIQIIVTWDPKINADVDTWVRTPLGEKLIGWSNQRNAILNLSEDDRGHQVPNNTYNREVLQSPEFPPLAGLYVVNLHLFDSRDGKVPLPVKVHVMWRASVKQKMQTVFFEDVILEKDGDEVTALRFLIDSNGVLKKSSIDQVNTRLLD